MQISTSFTIKLLNVSLEFSKQIYFQGTFYEVQATLLVALVLSSMPSVSLLKFVNHIT